MTLSQDEAARALEEIGQAGQRMSRLTGYADAAPAFMLWGAVWLVANLVSQYRPGWSGLAWLAGIAVGVGGTLVFTLRRTRRKQATAPRPGGDARSVGLRFALLGLAIFGFFASVFTVLGPLQARQADAFISLVFAFAYVMVGVWAGWRVMAIGVVTVAAILFGYLELTRHFFLWMGLVGGGALIAGGLWLRKI